MIYHLTKTILDFISTIAWPLVIFIIILIFKKELKSLIDKIKNVTTPGFNVSLEHEKQENSEVNITSKYLSQFSEYTIAEINNIINREKKDFQNELEYLKAVVVTKIFNETYLNIYGSQLRFLQTLNSKSRASKEELKYYYDNAIKSYPNMYVNYSYDSWLNWMDSQYLIDINIDIINITPAGRDFLTYLTKYGFNMEKYF